MSDIKALAKLVEDQLDRNEGYVLLTFPFGSGVEGKYSTNVYTEDALQALKAYANALVIPDGGNTVLVDEPSEG